MSARPEPQQAEDFVPTDELVRRQHVQPLRSVEDFLHEDPFSSDEEYAEFLRDLDTSRRTAP